ncbi:hypothetical protein CYY_004839 [Polysphondylium violaceum]|uniref:C3H1-type domain-containing protein n=1 Tax=Polysphondylium violaceum TaxID=133409 RepID=A0A8J4V026_9MYCE|nr:hypothetical protein CYY_004839 [Polysphondylium violaceum]
MSNSTGTKQEWSGTRYPVICKYFKSGTCKLGDSCRFSHSYGTTGGSTNSSTAATLSNKSTTGNSSSSSSNNNSSGGNNTNASLRSTSTAASAADDKINSKKVYNSQDGTILHSPTLPPSSSTPISYVNATTINSSASSSNTITSPSLSSSTSTTASISTSTTNTNNNNSNSNLNSSMSNLSLDDNEEFISYHTRSNPNRMAGRRPFLQLVVLYAADPRVLRFSKEVQSMFLDRGIDVFLKTEENNQSIKTENLAEIITGSKADCLIVLGDRNLKNRSCQAKRRGKLVEMDIEEAITCIWNEWSLLLPKEDEELTDEQVFNLLEKHCKLRHVKDRLSKFKTSINEFKEIKLPSKNHHYQSTRNNIVENPTFLDEKIASKLTSAQKSVMRFHLQVVEAIEYVEDMPFITQTEKLTSTRGSVVGPEVSISDSKPVISESNREKLLYHLSLILVKIEKLGNVLSEFGSPLWDAYYEEYREKQQEMNNNSSAALSNNNSSNHSFSNSNSGGNNSVANSSNGNHSVSNNSSNSSNSNNTNGTSYHIDDEPVVDMKPGQWRCLLCTYINDSDAYSCLMCLTPQPTANGDNDHHGWNNSNGKSGKNSNNSNSNQKKLSVQTTYVKVDDKSKKDTKLSIQTDQPKLSVTTTPTVQTTSTSSSTTSAPTTNVSQSSSSSTTTTATTSISTPIESEPFSTPVPPPNSLSNSSTTNLNNNNLNSSLPSIPTTNNSNNINNNTIVNPLSSSQPISFSTILSKDAYSSGLYGTNALGEPSSSSFLTTVPPEHYEEDFPALSEKVGSKSKNAKVTKNGIQSPSSPTSSANNLQPPLSPSIHSINNNNNSHINGIQSPTKLKPQQQNSFNLPINSQNNNNNNNSFPQSPNGKLFGVFESSSDIINSPRGTSASFNSVVNPTTNVNGTPTKGPNYYNIFANNTWESSIFGKDSSSANGSSYNDPLFSSWSAFSNNNNNSNIETNNNNNSNNNVNSKQSNGNTSSSSLFDLNNNIFQQSPFSSGGSSSFFNQPNSASTSSSASSISSTAFPSMYSQYSNSNSLSSLQQQYQQQFFNQQPFLNSTSTPTTSSPIPTPTNSSSTSSTTTTTTSSSSSSTTTTTNSNGSLNNTISNNNTNISYNNNNIQQQIQLQLFIQQQQNQQTQQHQQEQFEREKQRAREIVNEKYKHSQPPQRPCCYCGEESMLECYNCAKTGYATYFCSKEHQALMWKEHMRVHQFYANNFQQPQQQSFLNK